MKNCYIWILLILGFSLNAQNDRECGFSIDDQTFRQLPYYGNDEMLDKISAIIQKQKVRQRSLNPDWYGNAILYTIPVRVYVFGRSNEPVPSITDTEIETILQDVNDVFIDYGIEFYLECEIHRESEDEYAVLDTDAKREAMIDTWYRDDVMQWFMVDVLTNKGQPRYGLGYLPMTPHPFTLMLTHQTTATAFKNTTKHEVGHTLGLLHPHRGRLNGQLAEIDNVEVVSQCDQESVERYKIVDLHCEHNASERNCSVNGDAICDTEASPGSFSLYLDPGCVYDDEHVPYSKTDLWGETWDPPTENIMSYTSASCRKHFTPQQEAVMHGFLNEAIDFGTLRVNQDFMGLTGTQYSGENSTYHAPRYLEAPSSKTVNTPVICQPNSSTIFEAGKEIRLLPGFVVEEGAYFETRFGDPACNEIPLTNSPQPLRNTTRRAPEGSDEILRLWKEAKQHNLTNSEKLAQGIITHQLFPNPTSSQTRLKLHLPQAAQVSLIIRDQMGKVIQRNIESKNYSYGIHHVEIDTQPFSTGIYFYELLIDGKSHSGKLIKH